MTGRWPIARPSCTWNSWPRAYGEETLEKLLEAYAGHLTTADAIRRPAACRSGRWRRSIAVTFNNWSGNCPRMNRQSQTVAELKGQVELNRDLCGLERN